MWVLERDASFNVGTAETCRATLDSFGSNNGWCVGDGDTEPEPGTFDDSPFSIGRGFDIIVDRATMEIVYTTSHGTPAGNENLTGEDILAAVEEAVAD